MPVVRARRSRFRLGPWLIALPIALGALAGVAGLVVGVCVAISPGEGPIGDLINDLGGVDTTEIQGDPRTYDPFAALPAVQAYAGDEVELVEVEVRLVRADGTLDLKAGYTPQPEVTYTFVAEVARPDDAPPPGAGGANAGPWYETVEVRAYEPGQRRRRTTMGGGTNTIVNYTNKGMERTVSEPVSGLVDVLSPPACAISDLFAVAIASGAPADAVANVTYSTAGYEFSITGVGVNLEFGHDCSLRREG